MKTNSMLDRESVVESYLRTGSTLLDMAISCNKHRLGGIPTRRIIEFSGTGASGKTYICGEIAGDAIRKGYHVYVDDIERRWDMARLSSFGFESSDKMFHYLKPSSSVEDCFERMFKKLDKPLGKKILFIVDPIAALYAEQEKKSDKMSQARAKAIQKAMRFLKDRLSTTDDVTISVVFSNQLIDAVGAMFGPDKVTPCGNAMVHWPSVRVRFASPGKVTEDMEGGFKKVVGVHLSAEVIKNSEDDAFRKADFTVLYGYGIDDIKDNAHWLKTHTDVLGESEGWFQLPSDVGHKYKNQKGLKKFVRYIEDEGLEKYLARITREAYKEWHKPVERKPKVR
jgi:recombination protein RecA